MTRAQTEVLIGVLISVPVAAFCIHTLFRHFSDTGSVIDENRAITMFVLSPALALLVGIGWIANERFFTTRIDGSKGDPGSRMDINQRYLTNTIEQTILFLLAGVSFWFLAPDHAQALLPAMAIWFVFARILFLIGYHIRPSLRAAGFAGTFYPTLALIGADIYHLVNPS